MIRSLLSFAVVLGFSTAAFATDDPYYQIKSYKVTDVSAKYAAAAGATTMAQPGLAETCETGMQIKPLVSGQQTSSEVNPLNVLEVYVDQIINIGKKIFAVIEAGRPVVNIKIDTANALPKGLTCWSDLSGWNIPQSKVYNVVYYNGFGMEIVNFDYRLTYTAGGSADGVGQYITNATFMPANLSVAWGFEFNANAAIPSILNTGTRQAPVAGMQMNMDWKVTSPLAHEQATESYFVTGANTLVELE